jgi:hypothetical protein
MFRGKDVSLHYAAHAALPEAAVRAKQLIEQLRDAGYAPNHVLYEFEPTGHKWFPSFVELADGRLITDNLSLIAIENLPPGLSLGLIRRRTPPVGKKAPSSSSCDKRPSAGD